MLIVLVIMLAVASSSASFIWFMNHQQTRAGARYRTVAAAAAAEAGVHRVLSVLERVSRDGPSPGRTWRPGAYSEPVRAGALEGRFTVSLADEADGAILITSIGESGGLTRRLRARAYLASPALLVALYGTSLVRFERPPASLVILPYSAGIGDRPWIHIAAGQGIGFAASDIAINDPTVPFEVGPGPADPPDRGGRAARLPVPGPARILLARGAELILGPDQRVDVQQLRTMGVRLEGAVLRDEALPALPEPDRPYFQTRARLNGANAGLNEAAGKYLGDEDLALKRDSLYSAIQFERLLTYLQAGLRPARFEGVIYVRGPVVLPDRQQIVIGDGALITEVELRLGRGAGLQVVHSAATRTLPGVMVLDGALLMTQESRMRAHGLVYARRIIDLWGGAHLDVVGAVAGSDRGLSFRNLGASVVIRYDPAVLGTPGLRLTDSTPTVAWVAAWEESP